MRCILTNLIHTFAVCSFGRIRIISDEEEKKAALHSLGLRYNPDENAVVAEMDKSLARNYDAGVYH